MANMQMSTFTRIALGDFFKAKDSTSAWGSQSIGMGEGLTPGFGVHWMPAGRSHYLVPGPGIAGTFFIDKAWNYAEERFEIHTQQILERTAALMENLPQSEYMMKHERKFRQAEQMWGAGKNLGRKPSEYKPQSFYEKAKLPKIKGLTSPEVEDLMTILPKQTGITPSTRLLKRIGAARWGQTIRIGSGYKLEREASVNVGHIDFRLLDRSDNLVGWWESGISDLDRKLDVTKPFSTQKGLKNIFPGAQARVSFGSNVLLLADTDIPDRVQIAADGLYSELVNAISDFETNFKAALSSEWEIAKNTYRLNRGGDERAFRGRGRPFDPLMDVQVNKITPPPPRTQGLAMADNRMFMVNVFFAHPAATALNYGLKSVQQVFGKKASEWASTQKFRSWRQRGMKNPDAWRYKSFGA